MIKRNKSSKGKIAAEAALAAITAAGAAYWLYGSKDATKHRKMVSKWSSQVQKEVVAAAKKLKTLNKKSYTELVNKAVKRYSKAKGITKKELTILSRDLKTAWDKINKVSHKKISPKKSAKRTIKKARQ